MKIRIKKKLNEGKGADIISRGFYKHMIDKEIDKFSDVTKKVFNKFGGINSLLENNDEEIVKQAAELIVGLATKYKLLDDSKILEKLHELYMYDINLEKKEWQKKLAIYNKEIEDSRAEGKSTSFDEIMIEKETERHNKKIENMYNMGPARLVKIIYNVFLDGFMST